MPTFRIQLFSVLKERLGRSEIHFEAPSPITGTDLLDGLGARHHEIAEFRNASRLAVNNEYVKESGVITDSDEIALITPVSGG